MKTHRGYKYRIYPNAAQTAQISRSLGCSRFVYNHFLALRKNTWEEQHRNLGYKAASSLLTKLKHDQDHSWLTEADSMALQEALRNLDNAYRNFFEKRAGYPKFRKKRSSVQTYRTRNQNNCIRIEGDRILLPKLGMVRAKVSRLSRGHILNATVSRTATGKYFVSLCCEEELVPQPNAGGVIGIDLGIKELYVDSEDHHVPNPRYLAKYEKQLRREQRSLSRMIEANIEGYTKNRKPVWKKPLAECSNIQKQRIKVARIHEKIYNCRTDNLHKASHRLVSENQVIAIESLNVKGMVRNHHLAKAISDASWSRFVTMLEYKAFEHGCKVEKVPTFYPSSQTCSCCGYRNPKVRDLSVRRWTCPECGVVHDRDHNAAVNIKARGLELLDAS